MITQSLPPLGMPTDQKQFCLLFSATIAAMVGYAACKYTGTALEFSYCAAILTSLCFTQIFFRTEILEGQKPLWQQGDRSIINNHTHSTRVGTRDANC